jgi:hypothetical protein
MRAQRWWLRLVLLMGAALLCGCSGLPPAPSPTATPDPGLFLLTPPVPRIAFPRQEPVEGERSYMTASLVGVLELAEGCLWVRSIDGTGRTLPIWPPTFTLAESEDRLVVLDESIPLSGSSSTEEQEVAVVGQEVAMGGGHVPEVSAWVLPQIPPSCRGAYFLVGDPTSVRPNLRQHSELFTWERLDAGHRQALILRHTATFWEQAGELVTASGELVLYANQRCVQLQTGRGPGPMTLLWPQDWTIRLGDGLGEIVNGSGDVVARLGDQVTLRGRPIAQDWESELYRRAVQELPMDCCCTFFLVQEMN